ncbi:MAG: tetratricopeptide repeat protein [Lachnospiraceae bacterium]|nr:tetratricopeptide repeat protein [Lachnospiraceae bacterium]
MKCYRCGETLGRGKRCPECGADVRLYKRIMFSSNYYYNLGLDRARVRDLTGAVEALEKSLGLNKNNRDARNLLGLVYFEMGETVSALSEWVISRNLDSRDNIATTYLKEVQNNPERLDTINQTIKKYNQALAYCKQDSKDLAIIQLKKVIALNPKLVKAHQLLALLYIEEGRYDRAKKELRVAAKIDEGNTLTLRYMKEVNDRLKVNGGNKKPKKDDILTYQSGTETIIMPRTFVEMSTTHTIINLIIGIVLGIAVSVFLIMPGLRSKDVSSVNNTLKEVNETLATKESTIASLEAQIEEIQGTLDDANKSIEDSDTKLNSYKMLITAYNYVVNDDLENAGNALASVNTDDLSDDMKALYESLNASVSEQYIVALYESGYSAYNSSNDATAIEALSKVVALEEDYEDGNALFYLGQAYRRSGDLENAVNYFKRFVELHPGTQRASTAQSYINQYEASAGTTTTGTTTDDSSTTTTDAATTDNGTATDGEAGQQ